MSKITITTNERYLYQVTDKDGWYVSKSCWPAGENEKLWAGYLTEDGYVFMSPNRYEDKVLYTPLKLDGRLLMFVDFPK